MLKAIAPYVGTHSSTVNRTVRRTKGQKPAEPQCMLARSDPISFLTIIPLVPRVRCPSIRLPRVHIQGVTGQFVRSAGQSTKLMVPGSVQRLTTSNNGMPATVSLKFTQRSS